MASLNTADLGRANETYKFSGTYFLPFKLSEVTVLPNVKRLHNTGCQLSSLQLLFMQNCFHPTFIACFPLGRIYFPAPMTLAWPCD